MWFVFVVMLLLVWVHCLVRVVYWFARVWCVSMLFCVVGVCCYVVCWLWVGVVVLLVWVVFVFECL